MKNAEQETSRFGKYVILGELGHGGFATVYRARDASLKREVALKVLHPQLMVDPLFVTRFENDARAAGQLEHPHIVVIYDLGHLEGAEYIAMQLLAGGSLTARLRDQGRFTLAQTLRIVEQVAGALDYAHDRGFVHRDIKPSNILFNSRDEAVVADFGLVKAVETSIIARSSAGGVIGTPSYIAPEVWEGKEAGPATDIYALGCVIYELLTGQVLFAGDTSPAIMRAHFLPPRFPAAWPEGTPPDVQAILTKALAADPANRYARAGALADDLAALVQRAADPLAEPYRALQAALAAEDWASALTQAQSLAAANPDYRDVRALAQRAAEGQARAERAQWAAQWRGQTLEAIQAAQWDAARVAARRWLEMAPGDSEAAQAQQMIADSLAAAQPAESAALTPVSPSTAADARPEQSQVGEERQRGEETELRRGEAELKARTGTRRAAKESAGTDAEQATGNEHSVPRWVLIGIGVFAVALLALALVVLRLWMGDGAATPAPATEVSLGTAQLLPDTPTPMPTVATVPPKPTGTPTPLPDAIVNSATLNLRAGPGEVYAIVGRYAQGTAMRVVGKEPQGKWLQVIAPDGRTGWMSAALLRVNVPLGSVAVVPTPTREAAKALIAVQSSRDGNNEIYTMRLDGSELRNLTQNPAGDFDPSWSPDGQRLAFRADRDGNSEIYVMNSDGTDPKNITNNPRADNRPVWSPDGRSIVFESDRDGQFEVYVMNPDGTNLVNLTRNPAIDGLPNWSPDGRRIAFHSYRDGNFEIYVMAADGSSLRNVTNRSGDDFDPTWSPDAGQFAFASLRDGNWEVYVMNADGSNQRNITQNGATDLQPRWSPFGDMIAFLTNRNGKDQVYLIKSNGTLLDGPLGGGAAGIVAWYPR